CIILESNHKNLIAEFVFPKYDITNHTHNGGEYQIVTVAGSAQTNEIGKPQLPVKGFIFGIPPGAKATLALLDFDAITLSGFDILPVPKPVLKHNIGIIHSPPNDKDTSYEFFFDPAIYSKNSFYPEIVASTGKTGIIRDQYVGTIQIFPIQFNPLTHEIRWYKRIKIKIDFPTPRSKMRAPDAQIDRSAPFEQILNNSLLNYEIAKFWKVASPPLQDFRSTKQLNKRQIQQDWYKILINHDGIYRINKTDLEQAGVNTAFVGPGKIKIFNRGDEIPIHVKGQEDGFFDDSDYIEFFGTKTNNDYGEINVYWLAVEGAATGLRMVEKDGSLIENTPSLIRSKETIHFEENNYFSTSIPNGEGVDHWFWDYIIAPDTLNFSISLDNVAEVSADDCLFKIEYRGYTESGLNPDHHTIVFLNGYQVLDNYWDGRIQFNAENFFPQGYLNQGYNTISIYLPGDTGAESDIHYINWFEIDYWRDYVASDDSLIFWGDVVGRHQFIIRNFSSNNISVYDITDSMAIARFKNISIDSSGDNFTLLFQDNLNNKRRYFALTDDKIRTPNQIIAYQPSQLQSSDNRADYIIVTHEDFYYSLAPLINLRQSQGLTVATVKITDIYDEFNYGIKDPIAIKAFLNYAYHFWQRPAPAFVLLVGDASYDYKDYLNNGLQDYVSTHLFESEVYNTYTSSDNWFVCVSGEDNLPDMLIGRLPVRTANQAELMINKIIEYENQIPADDWHKKLLFIADNVDSKGNYKAGSDYLADNFVPSDFSAVKAYLDDYQTSASLRDEIVAQLNQGSLVTNYLGHGGIDFWANEKIFQSTDIAKLDNSDRLSFVVSLSCLNGYFQHPTIQCLAEDFVKAGYSGAIACYSPSGFANTFGLQILAQGLYSSLFQHQNYQLGSMIAQSKIEMFKFGDIYLDHLEFYNLFGDPALRLKQSPETTIPPSVYSGSITVDNNPAAIGSELTAWINDNNYPVNFSIRTPGSYGPMYIVGDDPNTPHVEGGANGDTVIFKLITGAQDTLLAQPSSIWESGVNHDLNLSIVTTAVKISPPISISITVNDKLVGREILDGDPIPVNSIISASIDSRANIIDNSKIYLLLNRQILTESQ
ncbi:MAG: C25 family cysteine peptidase, partial [bacterium]|nr:C25 family cysteine peptidase [bacterium]